MGRLLVALAVVVLCASLVAPAGAGDDEVTLTSPSVQEFDHTEFRIVVHENGSARWTFRYGNSLANESEEAQFREFARRFDNESLQLYRDFQAKAVGLAAEGSNQTGREMTATNFRKDARLEGLDDDLGVVEMSFTWTNFAATDGDRVSVGDVFEGGLYLGEGHRLVVAAAPPLSFERVEPSPDDVGGPSLGAADSVTWRGEHRFTDNHPIVVLSAETNRTTVGTGDGGTGDGGTDGDGGTTDGGGTGGDEPTVTTGDDPRGALRAVPWLVVTAFAAMIVVGAVVLLQRAGIAFDGTGPDGDVTEEPPPGPGDGPSISGEPAVPDEEMITDEERVLGLLRENGGRMRQVNIVDETGWSKSKVSMLLSEMEDDDQVTKLRVGRENIVSLPGHEPDGSGSALE